MGDGSNTNWSWWQRASPWEAGTTTPSWFFTKPKPLDQFVEDSESIIATHAIWHDINRPIGGKAELTAWANSFAVHLCPSDVACHQFKHTLMWCWPAYGIAVGLQFTASTVMGSHHCWLGNSASNNSYIPPPGIRSFVAWECVAQILHSLATNSKCTTWSSWKQNKIIPVSSIDPYPS